MKIRGLVVASVVFFILAGVLYWSEHRKPSEDTAKAAADAPPAILKLDEPSITKLEIRKKDAPSVLLAKSASGGWQIAQPQALGVDESTVSTALSTLSSLNSERLVEEKAADLQRYGLDRPSVEVSLTEKDNKTQKLLIGDETPTGSAVYAMLAADSRVFTVASYSKSNFDKSLNDLRDKHLLPLSADKISRVELIRKDQSLEFGRNKDDWQILKPKPLRADGYQVQELVRKLTDARMDLSGSQSDATEAAKAFSHAEPVATARLTDQSGSQDLQVRKSKDKYYARSSSVEGTYKIDSDLGQAVAKSLDDFRHKKLFDFSYNDPNKIELHDGQKAYFLTRNGADWWADGKKMDGTSVQDLVSQLRDLTADRFPTSGFANAVIEATVTSDDGKRVEKILIAKSGDGYVAQRQNEPALYQLTAGSIDSLRKAAGDLKPAAPAK